ncbi:ATP-dependent nuclease [Pseudomonas alkylphenolica]|uniref:ATP-dependent nuclease n=1 Tax=Pseudomonas alkylphenolica TaxID=237609 RepID=UPI0013E2939A|nr:ATP-binding protein [Pseudomonas alkylphenolica]
MTIDIGFWVRDYRGFKKNGAGFEVVKFVNVIVGKNNIGKSSIIEAVQHVFRDRGTNFPISESVVMMGCFTEEQLKSHFAYQMGGGDLNGNHWTDNGASLVDAKISWKENAGSVEVLDAERHGRELIAGEKSRLANVVASAKKPYQHVRLDADRDLVKEPHSNDLNLRNNGVGATNIIQNYINRSDLNRDLIQVKLLTALNDIFTPDAAFTEIVVQFHSNENQWEVYLGEEGKGLVPLSASGSGLKTIFLALLNLLVRPDFDRKNIDSYVFSFEELENNLHPSLQRNLFSFLLNYARASNCHIFLTTHSQVAIDYFYNEPDAQILHVKKNDGEVSGVLLDDLSHGYSVLDDLGAKASDILQANGIIWVEGPSDRIYLNKLIEIWGGGVYKEGHHYQYIYYGGSVLAHVNAKTDEAELGEAVSAVKINRNFIFVCDSDRRTNKGKLKSRVTDLLAAVSVGRGHVWVTRCKEIENYIPKESFELVHGIRGLPQIGEYDYIQAYLNKHKLSKATEFTNKHHWAVKYCEFFSKENLSFRPELAEEMPKIIETLMVWNS